jgi:hypothetical protein
MESDGILALGSRSTSAHEGNAAELLRTALPAALQAANAKIDNILESLRGY